VADKEKSLVSEFGTLVECDECDRPGVTSTEDGDWLCEGCFEEYMIEQAERQEEIMSLDFKRRIYQ
jgi:ribosomal protein L37AE/L43A